MKQSEIELLDEVIESIKKKIKSSERTGHLVIASELSSVYYELLRFRSNCVGE